jgi:hypothetical protein
LNPNAFDSLSWFVFQESPQNASAITVQSNLLADASYVFDGEDELEESDIILPTQPYHSDGSGPIKATSKKNCLADDSLAAGMMIGTLPYCVILRFHSSDGNTSISPFRASGGEGT